MGRLIGQIVTGSLISVLLVLVPRTASAAELVPTELAISAPSSVRVGGTASITATLTTESGSLPVPAAEVVLERSDGAGSWAPVASATTSTSGQVTIPVRVGSPSSTFRAHFTGTPALNASLSETVVVAAVQVDSRIFVYGPTALVDETSGTLRMRWAGADGLPIRATVGLYRHVKDQAWTKLGAVTTDSTGRAQVTIKPRVDTWYQFRGPAAAGWQSAVSVSWKVDNKPPGAVIVLPAEAPKPSPLAPQRRAIGAGANASIVPIPATVWSRMYGRSWTSGCPIGRSSLRYLTVNYWGFDGYRHRGELVVRSTKAMKFAIAMTKLYNARVPIRAMFLPDRFGYSGQSGGANDYASMRHDNTSAFNCRLVTGDAHTRSPHSYGTAIDLNPWENPFRSKDGWLPNGWWGDKQIGKYAWKRSDHLVVRLMREAGFSWPYGKYDAQHFHG
jgi:5-hydroxyisourate hydrolase-like protein (transthyretin family)